MHDWYAEQLSDLGPKSWLSEEDVKARIVNRVAKEILGYSETETRWELYGKAGRLDVAFQGLGPHPGLAGIIEVKRPTVDLLRRGKKKAWKDTPTGQLYEYLLRFPGTKSHTWGIVTNGRDWLVLRREGEHISTQNLADRLVSPSTLAELDNLLRPLRRSEGPQRPFPAEAPDEWLPAVRNCVGPNDLLDALRRPNMFRAETPRSQQSGYGLLCYLSQDRHPDGQTLFGEATYLACIRFDLPDHYIATGDIDAVLAGIGPDESGSIPGRIAGIAYSGNGHNRRCRAFFRSGKALRATALIDPHLPGSRAEHQFADLGRTWYGDSPERALATLSSEPLQKQFHEEVTAWFRKTGAGRNELRHLIRILFVWLLQERNVVPADTLWAPDWHPADETGIHQHIDWLFTRVLAVPRADRNRSQWTHPAGDVEWVRDLANAVPFLNGSLFVPIPEPEQPTPIKNSDYAGRDGIFPILRRYDWTLSDRTGSYSESAMDPAMLGDLFERLILDADGVRIEGSNRKMPGGTYYTPQDIADEMAADALAGWLERRLNELSFEDYRTLLHPSQKATTWAGWDGTTRATVLELLGDVRVLDPCCGSGAFTLTILQTLYRAQRRLAIDPTSVDMRTIIERQIFAVDVHPMAVMITRLRIFIALVDATKRGGQTDIELKPLPNLETRCIAADALAVEMDDQDRFGTNDEGYRMALANLAAARETWTSAHGAEAKSIVRGMEREARDELRAGMGEWATAEGGSTAWLDVDFLASTPRTAEADIRLLFPAPEGGWDIVIGNPPYQKVDPEPRKQGIKRGFGLATTNLYLMFIATALEVARQDGCIEFIVPHSIVVNRQRAYQEIRRRIESRADRVDFRTYGNRPRPVFPNLPWLKTGTTSENRQRVTVLRIHKLGGDQSTRSVGSGNCGL